MVRRWNADKPYDPLPAGPNYHSSVFSEEQCIQAEGQVKTILRNIGERSVTAQAVLRSMLPVFSASGNIVITEAGVRAAVLKILSAED